MLYKKKSIKLQTRIPLAEPNKLKIHNKISPNDDLSSPIPLRILK